MKMGANHPMGPLELADFVGLDTVLSVMRVLQEAFGDKYRPCPLLIKYVDAGYLGVKTGRGFLFLWRKEMIGFDLTPEQKALQEKARRFSKEVILPVAAQHDRDGTFPLEVMEKAHQEGFFTPLVPKRVRRGRTGGARYLHHLGRDWPQAAWGCTSRSSSAPWPSIPSSGLGQRSRRSDFSDLSAPTYQHCLLLSERVDGRLGSCLHEDDGDP